jgi:putative ABC transport system permease protein
MLSLYSTLSLRYLRRRWFRALLIVASIALGVATLVATRSLNDTMTRAGLAAQNPLAGTADLVVSNGEAPVERSLAKELAQIPGVEAALPRIFEIGWLKDLGEKAVLVVGADLEAEKKAEAGKEASARLWDLDIKLLDAAKNALSWDVLKGVTFGVIGKELQAQLPGKGLLRVQVPGQKEPAQVVVSGTIQGRGPLAALGGNVLVLPDLAAAGRMAGLKKGQVSRVDLKLQPGANRDKVKEAVDQILAGRAKVNTPEEKNQIVGNVMAGMQVGFSLCGLAALVVGLFLVYSALSVSVAERRHEIGILLSVGSTRRQVRALFAGEAALLGLCGALLGIPLGVGLAYFLEPFVQAVLRDIFTVREPNQIQVSWSVMLLAGVAGILTAVAACVVPAVAASREKPAEAVRRVPQLHTWRFRIVQVAASLVLVVVGTSFILFRDWLPLRVGMVAGLVQVLLGGLLATPLLAAVAARLLQPLARQLFGIQVRLAADNLVRSPQRTGLVIAALAAGVALVVQTAGTIRSNRRGLRDWAHEAFGFDLWAKSGSPIGTGGPSRLLDTKLARQIEKEIKGVERVMPIRVQKHPFGDTQVQVLALDAADYARINTPRNIGGLDIFRNLDATTDGVLISDNFAALHRLNQGDLITLASRDGPVHLRVVGQLADYSWSHGTIFVNRRDFLRHWKDFKVDSFDIYLRPDADKAAVKDAILRSFAEHGLFVQTREELQDYIDGAVEQLYSISFLLEVTVMLVAALGVVTAFLISVLQRRREMGLLRAIGASQGQVVHSVLVEAALMGVIGTAIGLVVGIPLEWFVLKVAILEESGYLFPMHIPWVESLVIAASALVLATLAGLGPALYAVRQRIPEAIAYE